MRVAAHRRLRRRLDAVPARGSCAEPDYSTSYGDTTLELDVRPQAAGADTQSRRRGRVELPAGDRRETGRPVPHPVPARRRRSAGRPRMTAGSAWSGRGRRHRRQLAAAPTSTCAPTTRRCGPTPSPTTPACGGSGSASEVREGATAQVVFDRLRFERTRQSNADAVALLARAVDAVPRQLPEHHPVRRRPRSRW